jgi:hypothetical protein
MGRTTATQIGNLISGVDYSFHGLEKAVVNGYEPGQPKRIAYDNAVNEISQYVKIVLPEVISSESIAYECTGSPKSAGYKTKEAFAQAAKDNGYHKTGLKDAKILFTDDLSSSSSKMEEAKKRGVEIKLYTDL